MKILNFIAIGAMVIALSACSSNEEPVAVVPNEYSPITMSRSEAEIVNTQNEFALKFFNEYASQYEGNFCVSPLSLSMTFSMVANGAAGETRKSIIDALGFESADMDAVNRFNARLANELAVADNTCSFALANSIWIDKDCPVKDEFLNKVREDYGAEIFHEDFTAKDILNKINTWCNSNTNGLIKKFLEDYPTEMMALYNATYFKGGWKTPFDKNLTQDGDFYNDGEKKTTAKFMQTEIVCEGLSSYDGYWLTLPYGNEAFRITFIMPSMYNDKHIDEYMKQYPVEDISEVLACDQKCNIKIKVPKFEVGSKKTLDPVLKKIGFDKMYEYCDFRAMIDEIVYPQTLQETYVKIDEEGAEAAAVTAESFGNGLSFTPINLKELIFNKPFAFIISEKSTNAILFMGRVTEL